MSLDLDFRFHSDPRGIELEAAVNEAHKGFQENNPSLIVESFGRAYLADGEKVNFPVLLSAAVGELNVRQDSSTISAILYRIDEVFHRLLAAPMPGSKETSMVRLKLGVRKELTSLLNDPEYGEIALAQLVGYLEMGKAHPRNGLRASQRRELLRVLSSSRIDRGVVESHLLAEFERGDCQNRELVVHCGMLMDPPSYPILERAVLELDDLSPFDPPELVRNVIRESENAMIFLFRECGVDGRELFYKILENGKAGSTAFTVKLLTRDDFDERIIEPVLLLMEKWGNEEHFLEEKAGYRPRLSDYLVDSLEAAIRFNGRLELSSSQVLTLNTFKDYIEPRDAKRLDRIIRYAGC